MEAPSRAARIAVIGVGNDFRGDDGLGWAVVAELERRARQRPLPDGTTLSECDGDPARMMTLWQGADLAIVVDAAHTHPGSPGRLHTLELVAGQPWRSPGGETSSHGLGLGEAVELARALDRLPRRLVIHAVEGTDDTLGAGMSAEVADAVQPLVLRIEEEIAAYGQR